MLNNKWLLFFNEIKFKFKPIVNIYTGETYAIEILNDYKSNHFKNIDEIFNEAYKDGILFQLGLRLLREKLKIIKNIKNFKKFNFF